MKKLSKTEFVRRMTRLEKEEEKQMNKWGTKNKTKSKALRW